MTRSPTATPLAINRSVVLAAVETAKEDIDRKLALFYVEGSEVDKARHVSLFAIGPIPLLAYLGSSLSDKIPVELYQRHRNPGDWSWKRDGPIAEYATRKTRAGSNPTNVALLLSLSGNVRLVMS